MTSHITRTWFEDGKFITETFPFEQIYKPEWVGLTDEEFNFLHDNYDKTYMRKALIERVEAWLMEKNT